jgi:hypothetical protein
MNAKVTPEPPNPPEPNAFVARVLLIDRDAAHAAGLAERLRREHLLVEITENIQHAGMELRRQPQSYKLVVVDVTDVRQPWISIVRQLMESSRQSTFSSMPLFLCFSRVKREPHFELAIERLGARYVCEE